MYDNQNEQSIVGKRYSCQLYVKDDDLYIIAGWKCLDSSKRIFKVDLKTYKCRQVGEMLSKVGYFTIHGYEDWIYIIGGEPLLQSQRNDVQL